MSKKRLLAGIVSCVAAFAMPVWAESCVRTSTTAEQPDARGEGVLVSNVVKDFAADKAGIKQGDILLRWSRGETGGNIDSPFCLTWVELDQAPRGPIVLEGFRDAIARTWILRSEDWSLDTRPQMPAAMFRVYETARQKAAKGFEPEWEELSGQINPPARAWLAFRSASWFASHQQWKRADEAFARALTEAGGEPLSSWRLELSWGNSFLSRGEYDSAQKHYWNGYAAIQGALPNTVASALTLKNVSMAEQAKEDIKSAQQHLAAALEQLRQLAPTSMAIADVYILSGRLAQDEADFDKAEEDYLQAASIQERLGGAGTIQAAWTLGSLAAIYSTRGELEKAENYLRKALPIERRFEPDSANLASILIGLGYVAEERGDWRLAEKYYLDALRMAAGTQTVNRRFVLHALGQLHKSRGQLNTAMEYFSQALALQRKSGSNSLLAADLFRQIGEVEYLRNHFAASEGDFKHALSIEDKIAPEGLFRSETLMDLGKLACRRAQLGQCEQYYRQAAELRERVVPGSRRYAEALMALGDVNRLMQRIEAATGYYQRAAAALEGQTARLGGSADTKAQFRASYEGFYAAYVDLLVQQGRLSQAFLELEQSRARVLIEMLSSALDKVNQGVEPELLAAEHKLRLSIRAKSELRIRMLQERGSTEQIKRLEKQIEGLTARYQEVAEQIRTASPNYAALTQPQPLTAKQIQEQVLDQNTMLLEYSLGEERSHVFVVTPESVEVLDLPKRAEVEAEARQVYGLLTARNREVPGKTVAQREQRWRKADAEYLRAAGELSRIVLGPVAEQIKDKRLVIVADGALHYIPFAALPEPGTDGKSSVPLALNHEIISLPSASVLALLRQQRKGRKPAPQAVAVLADPVFDKSDPRVSGRAGAGGQTQARRGTAGQDTAEYLFSFSAGLLTRSAADLGLRRNGRLALTRLRYTRQEADAIRATAPAGQALEAVDFKASRTLATSAELKDYRIIHFATHGLLNSRHPELSGLVLSLVDQNGQPQDGFLTLQDIYNMDLSADLVVLSACETGLGKEISGEGLIGLTRGFMYAGATRVVASLWKVSDVATAQLMAEFYRGMEKDGLAPAAALRAAQVRMWKQKRWSSPYYWAAFQIQGEWK